MSNKSPVVSAISIVAGIVIFAGGAAKLYRGISNLNGGTDPKVTVLLEQSDAAVEEANKSLTKVQPEFEQLLSDFDTLGVTAFRTEKNVASSQVIGEFQAAVEQLKKASQAISEALTLDSETKVAGFLKTRATSYDKLALASEQNIAIVNSLLDETTTDTDAIIAKITSIAEVRDAHQKEANELTKASDAMLAEVKK